jgi:hypothetical protein
MFKRPQRTRPDLAITRLGILPHPVAIYPWRNLAMHYLGCRVTPTVSRDKAQHVCHQEGPATQ